MNKLLRNILAVLAGWILGSMVNMAFVIIGHKLMPLGADMNDTEAFATAIQNAEPQHFIFPFLAHALGTLVGAGVAYAIAGSHKRRMAMIVGAIFFLGGLYAIQLYGGPTWFKALDLLVAYLPMAILGATLAAKLTGNDDRPY